MELKITEFDIDNTDQTLWNKYHLFRKQYHDENLPDDPYIEDKEYEKIRRAEFKDEDTISKMFIVENANKIIGLINYTMFNPKGSSYNGNEENLLFKIELNKEFRRNAIGSNLLKYVSKFAKDYNKTNLISTTVEEDGKLFLKAINAQVALSMHENRLYMNEVDWNMLSSWIEEAEKLNKDTKLLKFIEVPEEILESYCKTFTFAGNQSPLGNLSIGDIVFTPETIRKEEIENKKVGLIRERIATVEKDGTVSGLSELLKVGSDENVLRQTFTAVLEEYRGRKLGKWIKASQIVYVRDKYPHLKYIKTTNAETNAPMLSINNRLGFKKYRELNHFQISLEELNKYIQNKISL